MNTKQKCLRLFIIGFIFSTRNCCGQQKDGPREGDTCSTADPKWYPAEDDPHDFLYCHMKNKVLTRQRCSQSFNGQQKIFDHSAQQCLVPAANDDPTSMLLNETNFFDDNKELSFDAGPRTGDICQSDSECPSNGRCSQKRNCECRSAYLHWHRLCWQKLSPTDGPCLINEQCSASWPGAECYRGTCICPEGTVPVNTSGGILCTGPDRCPLGGPFVIVSQPLDGADPCQSCDEANIASSSNAYLYECVRGAGFTRPVCCPNKAMTCMQPQLSGNGQINVTRFAYNSLTDQCQEFEFYGGTMINSNVFQTKLQCENYCRKGCLRGNPETRNGRPVSCSNDAQCDASFVCYKRENAEAGLCCPSAESICNPFGGIGLTSNGPQGANDALTKEFDAGEEPDRAVAVYYPAIRYYYSASEKQCKTFLYRGVGGNFNNFLTMEQCHNFCAAAVCNSGSRAAINSQTNRWIRCRQDEQCPADFTCQNGSCCTGQKSKKAPSADFADQLCPKGTQVALRDNGGVIFCGSTNSCPQDAFCRTSTTSVDGEGICCAGHLLEFHSPKCPGNGSLPLITGKFQAAACSLGQQSGCAPPHTCAYASINATDGLCCLVPPEAIVCPLGMEKVMTEDRQSHRQCSPLHLTTCPEGGACVYNEVYGIYYCCSAPAPACPEDSTPFLDSAFGKLLNCTSNCPLGFACVNSPAAPGNRICCSEHPLIRQCLIGKALVNHAGIPYSCSTDSPCPPGYYCVSTSIDGSICCPRADHVCSLNVDFGSACSPSLETPSFYFDPTLRSCKTFIHRGCGGNDNRFSEADQCDAFCHLSSICQHGQPYTTEKGVLSQQRNDVETACADIGGCPDGYGCTVTAYNRSYCCLAPEAVCKQAKSSGVPCDDVIRDVVDGQRTWYFDSDTKKCQPMSYHGCAGNANRFHTSEACEQFCHPSLCPAGGNPSVVDLGHLQQCWKDDECHFGFHCLKSNEAKNAESSICCPSAETVCLTPIDKGEPCGVAQLRFGYNQTTGRCQLFSYLGCKGNDNNFPQLSACNKMCSNVNTDKTTINSICGDTSQPYNDGISQTVKRCRLSSDCPPVHRCTFGNRKVSSLGYCCPVSKKKCLTRSGVQFRTWPNKQQPNNDECSSSNGSSCPTNYSCQLTEDGYRRCCQDPDLSQVCPASSIRGNIGQLSPIRCDESDDQCSSGFVCVYNRDFGQFFCCLDVEQRPRSLSAPRINDGMACQDGTAPYVDPYLHTVRVCSPYLRFSCPTNYECVYNSRSARYQCCVIEEQTESGKEWAYRLACPTGMTPYFHTDERPIICQPTSSAASVACQSPSICQYSPLYWQFICCVADDKNLPTLPSPTTSERIGFVGNANVGRQTTASELDRQFCSNDGQCQQLFPRALCHESMCRCPLNMASYQQSCVFECPPAYVRTSDSRCQLPTFDFYYWQLANRRRYHSGRRLKRHIAN